MKDSFGCLDLASEGFEVLFEATWITRMADVPLEPGWARVGGPFDDPSVAVWSNGVAGVTANRDGGFAGLSNLYTQGDLDAACAARPRPSRRASPACRSRATNTAKTSTPPSATATRRWGRCGSG
ncbi:hypothetical protein [Amycolatopsis keratiniphila]|uniref:hypothetical protein n=1 Tax=Amycolatopsis keratiniphila TaxID=129921 RepID=UPI000AC4EBB1|nr:hypothetical protein [Amycolatopsis keratiniphila]